MPSLSLSICLGGQVLLCKLAFCMAAKEPVLLSGPSCFKGHCVGLLARSLAFEAPPAAALNTLYLSQLTEAGDLEGSIEPHSRQSFVEYLQPCCERVAAQHEHHRTGSEGSGASLLHCGEASPMPPSATDEDVRGFLAWHAARATDEAADANQRSNARWCAALRRELDGFETAAQGFPYCERGVMPSVRFGGVLFLRGFEMPDQAVVEGLNALLELDRSFRSVGSRGLPPSSPGLVRRCSFVGRSTANESIGADPFGGRTLVCAGV